MRGGGARLRWRGRRLAGADAVRLKSQPMFVDHAGRDAHRDHPDWRAMLQTGYGAVVLEMASACWVLPE